MNSISANLNLMIKACEKASKILIRDFGEIEKLQVSKKGPSDFVTNSDLKTEKIILIMDMLKLIGRTESLFDDDIASSKKDLESLVSNNRFLVIGGAGSIGQAVTREIFKRNPLALHVVDISENNMVELVRDFRSSLGYSVGDFQTFALDQHSPPTVIGNQTE